jgi:hypothetical protein
MPSTSTDSGIEIMNVNGGPRAAGGFGHYPPQEIQRFTQAGGKSVLEREWRRLPISGLREIGGQETVDNYRVNFAFGGVRQSVAAFDSGEEALGHEEALLVYGGRKHHIIPHFESPTPGARRQVEWAGGARRLAAAVSRNMSTNAKEMKTA